MFLGILTAASIRSIICQDVIHGGTHRLNLHGIIYRSPIAAASSVKAPPDSCIILLFQLLLSLSFLLLLLGSQLGLHLQVWIYGTIVRCSPSIHQILHATTLL